MFNQKKIKLIKHPKTHKVIKEEWKSIEGFKMRYLISNYGRLLYASQTHGYSFMSLCNDKDGYKIVGIVNSKGIKKMKRIHQLVALSFLKNPNNYPIVHHLDNNRQNNFYLNLKWCSNQQNLKYMFDQNRNIPTVGTINGMSKLSEKEVLLIRQRAKTEKYKIIANDLNIGISSISQIVNRKTWKHI